MIEQQLIAYYDDLKSSFKKTKSDITGNTSKKIYKSTLLCSKNIFEFKQLSNSISLLSDFNKQLIDSIYNEPNKAFIFSIAKNNILFEKINIESTKIYSIYKKAEKSSNLIANEYKPDEQIYKVSKLFFNLAQQKLHEQESCLFDKLDKKQQRFESLFFSCFLQFASGRNSFVQYYDDNSVLYQNRFNAALSKNTKKTMQHYREIVANLHDAAILELQSIFKKIAV